ncbi:MAG: VCBS repeat-containing protein, partial [Chlorobi bacterium]|nr:VCBS repeat-containing protein [Chlorobiota bacterium]
MKTSFLFLPAIVLFLLISETAFSQASSPFTPVTYSSLAWADYNNDGFKDLLLTGKSRDEWMISKIYKNNGDGTFTDIHAGLQGVYKGSVAWGDYNNDGFQDILITGKINYQDKISLIYKNNGDGTFTDIHAGLQEVYDSSVAWIDYNNDGFSDILLTGNIGNDNLPGPEGVSKIYKNNGDGTFTEQTQINLTDVFCGSVACADYNNDGFSDILLTGNIGNYISTDGISKIYKNNGNGTFTEQTDLLGVSESSVAWGDYNNDGFFDILLSGSHNPDPNTFILITKVYKNNGDGTFSDINAGLQNIKSGSIAWGDYNNDNFPDIILTGEGGNNNTYSKIYKNNGDETFTEQTQDLINVYNSSAAWEDYNNDGKTDFIISGNFNDDTGICKLYKNNGNDTFTPDSVVCPKEIHPVENLINLTFSALAWSDYNNDGYLDFLITGKDEAGEIHSEIYRNNGDETFTDINAGLTGIWEGKVAWGDFNNDGFEDILITGAGENDYIRKVCKNNGDETFTDINVNFQELKNVSLAWGDYNNDGFSDILYAGSYYNDGSWHYVTTIYKNNGDETFTDINAGLTGISGGDAAWGDYNNDGFSDFVITGYSSNGYVTKIFKNNGDGTFTDINVDLTGAENGAVNWGDYNNDGYLDILLNGHFYESGYQYTTKVYRNNGNDTFTDINAGLTGIHEGSSRWIDFNNDNYPDIVISGYSDYGKVTKVYKNNGNDTFTDINADLTDAYSGDVDCGDCNNDGFPDILLSGDSYNGYITKIYKNNGNETFSAINKNIPDFTKVFNSFGAWGDYDKNNYQDLILSGTAGADSAVTDIYQNSEKEFVRADINLPVLKNGSDEWIDFNNDGYLDILLTGKNNLDVPTSLIYQNGGNGVFINSNINIEGVYESSVDWADYNNDGYPDLLIAGKNLQDKNITKLYKNTGNNNFSETFTSFPGASEVKWTDVNKDRKTDILLVVDDDILLYKNLGNDEFEFVRRINYVSGNDIYGMKIWDVNNDGLPDVLTNNEIITNTGDYHFLTHEISPVLSKPDGYDYINSGLPKLVFKTDTVNLEPVTTFYTAGSNKIALDFVLPQMKDKNFLISDWDNDRILDFILSGKDDNGNPYTQLFKNSLPEPDNIPSIPTGLNFSCIEDIVYISWNKATDTETPQNSLTYNCYMYEIGGDTIWHSLSNQGAGINNGKRYIPKEGNAGLDTSWFITGLDVTKKYAWSVQTVDYTFEGSPFAPEDTFRLAPAFTLQPENKTICQNSDVIIRVITTGADSYQWQVNKGNGFTDIENNETYNNATTSDLSIKGATLDMNNCQYRCAATTVGGTTYSNPAILTVDTLILADAGED